MSCEDNGYKLAIKRGHSPINDHIFDFLKTKITGSFLDCGCNYFVLGRELPNGKGIDLAQNVVEECIQDGLNVRMASVLDIPYKDKEFDMSILSCVLQQVDDWQKALLEARRVAHKTIGLTPYPERSQWGRYGSWVNSVIDPKQLQDMGAMIEVFDEIHYYFSFDNSPK